MREREERGQRENGGGCDVQGRRVGPWGFI
jgi:hypothetical protein